VTSSLNMKADIKGVEEAARSLNRLEKAVRNKVKRKALTKGSQVVNKQIKQNAPTDSKLLRKSLAYKVRTYRQSGVMVSYIGPRLGFREMVRGKPRDPRYYAHIVERGRKAVAPKKKSVLKFTAQDGRVVFGRKVRAVAGTRFMNRAWVTSSGPAQDAMIHEIKTGLEQEAGK
jgi:HK97 gp10 family phage protein